MCHRFHPLVFASVVGLLSSMTAVADEESIRQTIVYKTVGDLPIKADIYAYDDDRVRPAVVWIHGGALINGHREGINQRVRRMSQQNGYVLVSIDYRLAPETLLPEIIADLEDAFSWVRTEGVKRFHIDPNRIAVCGGSAGGYLTLATGHRVDPPPKVLLALWGYGDLVGPWYSRPSPHPRHQRPKLTREEAWKQVSGQPISDSRQRDGNGGFFYVHCRQTGSWPKAVSGWDPDTESDKFEPYMPVKNVGPGYPPTVLIHGTKDTDVPYQQSTLMAKQLSRQGVEHLLLPIGDAEHGLQGGDGEEIEKAYRQAFQFLTDRLND